MKINFDHQIFSSQRYGGISRYFYEIIRRVDGLNDTSVDLPIIFSDNYYISDRKYTNQINFFKDNDFKGKNRFINLTNMVYSKFKLESGDYDVFHPTYYDPYFLKKIGNAPFVLTVHDMIHEKFPSLFNENDNTSLNKRLLVEKASRVIAVSENTKKDLIGIFGTDESKIEVIYHGNSMQQSSRVKINLSLPDDYILFVGARYEYKNFIRFISSMSSILNLNKNLNVVCAGGGCFTNKEQEVFANLNIKSQVYQCSLNDESLAGIYQNAIIFVFPSLYEGFGIPILEAFSSKCPVACSNISSLPEIAKDGACYFDPYDEESIKNSVKQLLKDESLRKRLVSKGTDRLDFFSWEKAAKLTGKVYKDLM
jgi:glycosyltransferase involved in cell wall biosynthesis